MPKFCYVRNALSKEGGISRVILRDDAVFGVRGDKDLNIIQSHDITEAEAELELDALARTYKFKGRVKAGREK